MADLQTDLGPAIDPDTACVACNSAEQPESMLICDSCQQGFHLSCFGLAAIPEEDQWVCAGCTALQQLQPGSSILLESPQVLYNDNSDPHLTQGLFKGTIKSLGKLQQDSSCTIRQVQAEMDLAPVAESLKFYSNSKLKQLVRPPKPSLQLAKQLYELPGAELSSIVLSSRRHNMFGSPAAAAGLATEAWCTGETTSIASALQALAQAPKQVFLLERSKTHKAALPPAPVEPAMMMHTTEQHQPARTVHIDPPPQSDGPFSMQYSHFAPVMPYFYPPLMPPFGWPHGLMPSTVPAGQQTASNQYQGMLPFGWPHGPGLVQHGLMPHSVPAGQKPASISAAIAAKPKQQARTKRVKQQLLVQEAYKCDDDSDAADTSDDDWIGQGQVAAANAQVTKVVYKDYFDFEAGNARAGAARGVSEESQRAIQKWLEENK